MIDRAAVNLIPVAPCVPAKLLRDRSPEARFLGGWYVEFQTNPGEKFSTDYCRSARAAMAEALALAFNLGIQIEVRS